MSNIDISKDSAVKISNYIKNRKISVKEVLDLVVQNYEAYNADLNAMLSFDSDMNYKKAEILQDKIDKGELNGHLAGIPIALKDNICTTDEKTTCASRILENYISPYKASVAENIELSGMFISGKCNMDEFGMGSTNETSAFGIVKNPWDLMHSPGGSSGGSAAAIASGMASLALGSDTGGSVRLPSSFCGITGLKPTYGSVSRYGLIAYASSFDQIGPLGIYAEDIAATLDVISGPDKKDSTCIITEKPDHLGILREKMKQLNSNSKPLESKKIAVLKFSFSDSVSSSVQDSLKSFISELENMGAVCDIKDSPTMKYIVPAYYIIAGAQASSNLARYDGIKYSSFSKQASDLAELYTKTRTEYFGNEVIRRILLGSFVLSAGHFDEYYITAQKVNGLIKKETDNLLEQYDAILCPVCSDTAPLLGESLKDPVKMYANDIFTVTANLTGLPAISMPAGFDSKGLPIGMQLMAKAFDEDTLLLISSLYQERTGHHLKRPFDFNLGGVKK